MWIKKIPEGFTDHINSFFLTPNYVDKGASWTFSILEMQLDGIVCRAREKAASVMPEFLALCPSCCSAFELIDQFMLREVFFCRFSLIFPITITCLGG